MGVIKKWLKFIFAKKTKDSLYVSDKDKEKAAKEEVELLRHLQSTSPEQATSHSELFAFRFGQK